jgi:hypothetical protein
MHGTESNDSSGWDLLLFINFSKTARAQGRHLVAGRMLKMLHFAQRGEQNSKPMVRRDAFVLAHVQHAYRHRGLYHQSKLLADGAAQSRDWRTDGRLSGRPSNRRRVTAKKIPAAMIGKTLSRAQAARLLDRL